jgi:hypothetical protein
LAGLLRGQRRNERVWQLIFPIKRKLNLLAALLLEGGDNLPQRRVLLRVGPFLPPHDEIGRLGAKGRHREHRGENRSSAAHVVTFPIARTASISSLLVPGNVRANFDWWEQVGGTPGHDRHIAACPWQVRLAAYSGRNAPEYPV